MPLLLAIPSLCLILTTGHGLNIAACLPHITPQLVFYDEKHERHLVIASDRNREEVDHQLVPCVFWNESCIERAADSLF